MKIITFNFKIAIMIKVLQILLATATGLLILGIFLGDGEPACPCNGLEPNQVISMPSGEVVMIIDKNCRRAQIILMNGEEAHHVDVPCSKLITNN